MVVVTAVGTPDLMVATVAGMVVVVVDVVVVDVVVVVEVVGAGASIPA